MAYTPSTLNLVTQSIGGESRIWTYESDDTLATIGGTDYFEDAAAASNKGLRLGDVVIIYDADGTSVGFSQVSAIDADDNATVTIAYGTNLSSLTVTSTDAGATAGPTVTLHRDSASPADNDVLAQILFAGEDDGSTQTTYGAIQGVALDVTNATEDGQLDLRAMVAGTLTTIASVNATGVAVTGAVSTTGAATVGGALAVTGATTLTGGVVMPRASGTATTGAVTVTGKSGKITTEALTTAAGAAYTLTMTNTDIAAADIVLASVAFDTCTTGVPMVSRVTPAAGSCVIVVTNEATAAAFNGTLVISYVVIE